MVHRYRSRGVSIVEYTLILVLVIVPVLASMNSLKGVIKSVFTASVNMGASPGATLSGGGGGGSNVKPFGSGGSTSVKSGAPPGCNAMSHAKGLC